MSAALYVANCLTTLLCAMFLLRTYVRAKKRGYFWAGLCFAGLTVSNLFVIADLVLFPEIDFYTYRLVPAAIAMVVLLGGLIWEVQ